MVKNLLAMPETRGQSLVWEDLLRESMATLSSILENYMDRGAGPATVHGVTKSQTRLKRLSSNNSIAFIILIII